MKTIMPEFDQKSKEPVYMQLFAYIRDSILSGETVPGEKLPSLRNLSESLGISITTTSLAYEQLEVEGYITSKPRSGYYVSSVYLPHRESGTVSAFPESSSGFPVSESNSAFPASESGIVSPVSENSLSTHTFTSSESGSHYADAAPNDHSRHFTANHQNLDSFPDNSSAFSRHLSDPVSFGISHPGKNDAGMLYDLSSFDFVKWKKCFSKILTDYPQALLFESDPQGEEALRYEIARYIYTSRGVRCSSDQIVIAAGTQQITSLLALLLRKTGIEHVAVEDPGYAPVITSFRDHSFALTKVPVEPDGIRIEKLPANIRAAAYVNPSNQFPTGAVMPISRRYMLLKWAEENDSFIIEDDYDSELRYTGRPIPAMQGLDKNHRVIYLGSFSSTLFASVKISYMVLPPAVLDAFNGISDTYTQTCSKTEQLTLALFMEKGYYQTGIKKLRRLYSQKLRAVLEAFEGHDEIRAVNTSSGINVILELKQNALDISSPTDRKSNPLNGLSDNSNSAPQNDSSANGGSSSFSKKQRRTNDELPQNDEELLSRAKELGVKMISIAPGRLMMNYNQIPLPQIPELIHKLLSK